MPSDSSHADILLALSSQKAFLEDPLIRPIVDDFADMPAWRTLISIWEKRCLSGDVDEQLFMDFHLDFLAWSAGLRQQAIVLKVKMFDVIETIVREEETAGEPLTLEPSMVRELANWRYGDSREILLAQLPIDTRRELERDCEED